MIPIALTTVAIAKGNTSPAASVPCGIERERRDKIFTHCIAEAIASTPNNVGEHLKSQKKTDLSRQR